MAGACAGGDVNFFCQCQKQREGNPHMEHQVLCVSRVSDGGGGIDVITMVSVPSIAHNVRGLERNALRLELQVRAEK